MIKKSLEISFKKDRQHNPLYLQLESEIIQLICVTPGNQVRHFHLHMNWVSLQLNRKTMAATYEELSAQGGKLGKEVAFMFPATPDTSARAINQNSKKLIRSRQPTYPLFKTLTITRIESRLKNIYKQWKGKFINERMKLKCFAIWISVAKHQ